MTLLLLSGPGEEPVSLEDARAYLRLDDETQDGLVHALMTAARLTLEAATHRAFVTQSWRMTLDQWPVRGVTLPLAPLQAITQVSVDGVALASERYIVDLTSEPPRLQAASGFDLPAPAEAMTGIAIDMLAGYGASADVPLPLKQAILMLTAHWFDNREAVAFGAQVQLLPMGVEALIAPYRRLHL